MKQALAFVCVLFVCSVGADRWVKERFVEKWYDYELKQLMALVSHPQMPQRYLSGQERFFHSVKDTRPVLQFSWSSCGKSDDPVKVNSFSISPDPIHVPGDLTVSFDVSTSVNITSPLQVALEIQKKVAFWWVDVPCLDDEGSCTYSDFCVKLPATCPPAFTKANVPCHCPINQGTYSMTNAVVSVPSLPLPSWASNGDYKAKMTGSAAGQELFCINIALTLD